MSIAIVLLGGIGDLQDQDQSQLKDLEEAVEDEIKKNQELNRIKF